MGFYPYQSGFKHKQLITLEAATTFVAFVALEFDMPAYTYIIAILLGYLVGSLPFGFWIGRMRGIDVRTYFSGRTGATNVYRALGARLALLTGVLDFLKGRSSYWRRARYFTMRPPPRWQARPRSPATTGRCF